MLKRTIITSILCVFAGGLLGSYFFFVGRLAAERSAQEICRGVKVVVLDSLENSLISADEVKERLADWNFSGRCDNINLYEIETAIRSFGEVADAQVFRRDRNNIEIDLAQRKPAVRFIKGGTSHYADCNGYLFPVYHFTDVPVVTGFLPFDADPSYKGPLAGEERDWINGILSLTEFISGHKYWESVTQQIDIAGNGDILLYLKSGSEVIIFGDSAGIEEKFRKLEAYYRNIVPSGGGRKYSIVNLKFDNQIICK